MRTIITVLVISLGLHSCSCNFHLRKARGKCGYTADTITIHDTAVINSHSIDTLFRHDFLHQSDTIVIKENGVVVKYFYNTKDSTVYLKGEREVIKIPYEKKVIVNKYKMSLPWWVNWLKWLVICLLVMVAGVYAWSKLKPKVAEQLNK